MAYSKIMLNEETLMDVTSDTVEAADLVSGKTATKNDGTKVTGTITTKSSSDLTVSGATVTAPAGFYSSAASKSVSTTTHPNPTASIASSTGIVTATHVQSTGYVTGGTTTGTLNLTTQAAQTLNTSTVDRTISSYRWLTGVQTIKSVTTSNLTAGNIASGVTVKVGDANNASRISQVTGTYSPATSTLTVTPTTTSQTFNATGVYGYKPVTVNAIPSSYIIPSGTSVITENGTYDVTSFASASVSISGSGSNYETDIINHTLSGTYSNDSINKVLSYVFVSCSKLKSIYFNGCYQVDQYAFRSCSELNTFYAPNCYCFNANAFDNCKSLGAYSGYITLSNTTTLGTAVFRSCGFSSISGSEVHCPFLSEIGSEAFEYTSIESIYTPMLSRINSSAFSGAAHLSSIIFDSVYLIGSYAFSECYSLSSSIIFRQHLSILQHAFQLCTNIQTVYFYPKSGYLTSTTISNYAFYSCRSLLSVYILTSDSVTAYANYAFSNTNPSMTIFVPESLYSTYIVSDGWSYYTSQITSMTSSEMNNIIENLPQEEIIAKILFSTTDGNGTEILTNRDFSNFEIGKTVYGLLIEGTSVSGASTIQAACGFHFVWDGSDEYTFDLYELSGQEWFNRTYSGHSTITIKVSENKITISSRDIVKRFYLVQTRN